MCSVRVMRLQSSATGWSLLPALAARHAHLVRQAGEDARPLAHQRRAHLHRARALGERPRDVVAGLDAADRDQLEARARLQAELLEAGIRVVRSEEHTSELQSLAYLVCRLLLEKKKKILKSTRVAISVVRCTGSGA